MRARTVLGLAGAATLGAALWWRVNPSACPYGQRFWVEAPHPIVTRDRLRSVLAPAPGERLLEIGPGTGYYTYDMADWVGPEGRVEIFDLQQKFLDHVIRGSRRAVEHRPDPGRRDRAPLRGRLDRRRDPDRRPRRDPRPGRRPAGDPARPASRTGAWSSASSSATPTSRPWAPSRASRATPASPTGSTPATGSPTSPAWRRLRPPADSSGTSSCAGSRRPGRLRRSACRSGGRAGRPGGRRRDRGARAAPRPTSTDVPRSRTSPSSSALSPSSARSGLIRAAKHASLLKMLPIPATSRWSRSASPSCRSAAAGERGRGDGDLEIGGEDVRAEPAQHPVARDLGPAEHPQGRAAELGRLVLGAAQDRPGGSRRPAKVAARAADPPRPAHPEVAVEDEVAETEEQMLAAGLDPRRGCGRRVARRRLRGRGGSAPGRPAPHRRGPPRVAGRP